MGLQTSAEQMTAYYLWEIIIGPTNEPILTNILNYFWITSYLME